MAEHDGALGDVYGATSAAEIAALYDGWADSYEEDMARNRYRHPAIAAALLARHLPRGSAPVLDAGAGTGLSGEWLGILGYPEVEALDLSEKMLAAAAAKGVYTKLHRLALGDRLPFPDGAFAGVISAGVFTTGHVGAEALPELIRIVRAQGVIVLTVKMTVWEDGFADALDDAANRHELSIREQTAPYVSMPGDPATIPGIAIALQVLR